jgi:hypothetical protein
MRQEVFVSNHQYNLARTLPTLNSVRVVEVVAGYTATDPSTTSATHHAEPHRRGDTNDAVMLTHIGS